MEKMIRKQVYIEPIHDAIVKKRARMFEVSEAEIIRKAIRSWMVRFRSRDLKTWEREKDFIAKRMPDGTVYEKRKFKREDAYEERLSRYGS